MHDVWTIRGIPLKVEVTKTVKVNLFNISSRRKLICALHMHKTLLKRVFIKDEMKEIWKFTREKKKNQIIFKILRNY